MTVPYFARNVIQSAELIAQSKAVQAEEGYIYCAADDLLNDLMEARTLRQLKPILLKKQLSSSDYGLSLDRCPQSDERVLPCEAAQCVTCHS